MNRCPDALLHWCYESLKELDLLLDAHAASPSEESFREVRCTVADILDQLRDMSDGSESWPEPSPRPFLNMSDLTEQKPQ